MSRKSASTLPPLVIFDLDDTLSNTTHRRHYVDRTDGGKKDFPSFFGACSKDTVIEHMQQVAHLYMSANIPLAILSGRPASTQTDTIAWLTKHQLKIDHLHLRPHNNFTKDFELKGEWAQTLSKRYQMIAVYDDLEHNLQALSRFVKTGALYMPQHDPHALLESAKVLVDQFAPPKTSHPVPETKKIKSANPFARKT